MTIRPLYTAVVFGLIIFFFATANQASSSYDLPSIGQPADSALSPKQEDEIGKDIVRQLRSFNYLLDDIELRYYMNDLGRRIASFSGHPAGDFDFFVVRDNRVNAFALPGGYIGMNAGLILTTRNEDELCGVLAHEVAHVTQRHIARQIEASGAFNIATIAALVVAILAGASDPDVAQAALSLGMASAQQMQINFTRTHEMEADRVGIRTLAEAGYNPLGMATFFQQMEERARLYGSGLPEILQSHPVSNTRISEAMTRAAEYDGSLIRHHDATTYQLMQARLRVLTTPQVHEALKYFAADLKKEDNAAARFGYALAQARAGKNDDAIRRLEQLQTEIRHPAIDLALTRAQMASGEPVTALASAEAASKRYPGNIPALLTYADLLVQTDQPAAARKLILADDLIQLQEPEAHRLLAVAANDMGRTAEAHYQMAEYHRISGEFREALNQLHAGLRNKSISESDKARLAEALKVLEKQVPERLLREIKEDRQRG